MLSKAEAILSTASDGAIARAVLESFREVERNYFLRSWKTSELDAGHFVEAVRRFIEHRLFGGIYTPIGANLRGFNDQEMKRLENGTGDDSYRLHIPRALLFVYGLRNKRGVGHLSPVSANYVDATVILGCCKWILGELLRIESTLSISETSAMVERIVERPLQGVWEVGSTRRVLAQRLRVQEQILFLLFIESPQTAATLQASTETQNGTYFRKVLKKLHAMRDIEYAGDGTCQISPKGRIVAEKIALSAGSA